MSTKHFFLRKNSWLFLLFFMLFQSLLFSQEKGIILKNKKTGEIEFINANKRVKVYTTDGMKYTGRITIIDDNTIQIKNDTISLESIMKLKRRSVTSVIIEKAFYFIGGCVVASAILVATVFPDALVFIPLSFPIYGAGILVSGLENSHKKEKWEYSIGVNEIKTD
jgi:small nuclear ribonucleoprotein (snRNP)-like protein